MVDAGAVTARPDDAGADFAQGYERVVLVLMFFIENAHKGVPLPGAVLVQADSVIGGIP